ncbi:helix-turn-helix transcriptional regulator (plasmid) [Sinorhizobium chiapasense]|uniref:AraC family transcriptional regulator n=1 Tax=Sinorhizobium chiapasense TaxID=501572 RepID=UPI002FE3DF02
MPNSKDAVKYIVTREVSYRNAQFVDPHSHRRGQLIYAIAGVMEVIVGNKLWLVPPQRAVWMPPGVVHQMRARGNVELKTVYLSPDVIPHTFPPAPILVSVSNLLRELVLRSVDSPNNHDSYGLKNQILSLILDEIGALLSESQRAIPLELALPQCQDRRLSKVCAALLEDPGCQKSLDEWADLVGASKRTLARRFQSEFGMSFLAWRQQVRVAAASTRLDQGEPVTIVAGDLGYETPAAFSAMFRRVTGLTPSGYVANSPAPGFI